MKKNPISHYYRVRIFSILTFLKRGNFTLVKILFMPFPDATTAPASIHVRFLSHRVTMGSGYFVTKSWGQVFDLFGINKDVEAGWLPHPVEFFSAFSAPKFSFAEFSHDSAKLIRILFCIRCSKIWKFGKDFVYLTSK